MIPYTLWYNLSVASRKELIKVADDAVTGLTQAVDNQISDWKQDTDRYHHNNLRRIGETFLELAKAQTFAVQLHMLQLRARKHGASSID